MPYKVAVVSTPLWADHQRSFKNGKLAEGTEFRASEAITDGGIDMLHVIGEVQCIDGHKDGGWVELKNCERVQPTGPTPSLPVTPVYGVSEQEAMDALKILVRFLRAVE